MSQASSIVVRVSLLPPLSDTAGREQVKLVLSAPATLGGVIDGLLSRFPDPKFRLHLYDTDGRLIPAWSAFINGKLAPLSRGQGLMTPVEEGDEVCFLLNLAGG